MRAASSAVCLLLGVLCASGVSRAFAQTSTLRLGLPIAIDSPTGLNIREFARQVEARTGVAISIEVQGKDGRYDERGIVAGVATGGIEMGATPLHQIVEDVPLAGAFQQPFLFNFDALVEAATKHESEIRALFDKAILFGANARVLWLQPYGSSVVVSRKTLVTNPMSIAARIVSSPDHQTRELMKVCGGVPSHVSPASLLTALQSGTIHAAAADIMNIREHDLWRAADTISNLRHAPSLFMVVISDKAWKRLSREHQEVFVELAQDAHNYMWARFATIRAQAYELATRKGMRIVEPAPDEVAAWRACSAPLLEAFIGRVGDAGWELFRAYGKLRTDPCCRDAPGDTRFLSR